MHEGQSAACRDVGQPILAARRLSAALTVQPLKPKEIRDLRLREGASQAVFARYLNVTTGLVSQWERGEKHPQGASLKLLTLIAKNGLQAVA